MHFKISRAPHCGVPYNCIIKVCKMRTCPWAICSLFFVFKWFPSIKCHCFFFFFFTLGSRHESSLWKEIYLVHALILWVHTYEITIAWLFPPCYLSCRNFNQTGCHYVLKGYFSFLPTESCLHDHLRHFHKAVYLSFLCATSCNYCFLYIHGFLTFTFGTD